MRVLSCLRKSIQLPGMSFWRNSALRTSRRGDENGDGVRLWRSLSLHIRPSALARKIIVLVVCTVLLLRRFKNSISDPKQVGSHFWSRLHILFCPEFSSKYGDF